MHVYTVGFKKIKTNNRTFSVQFILTFIYLEQLEFCILSQLIISPYLDFPVPFIEIMILRLNVSFFLKIIYLRDRDSEREY